MQIENVSVSVELVSNTLVSGGVFNGMPAYYSYATNVKRNWSFTVYGDNGDYIDLLDRISFFGYNTDSFENISGNITSVRVNSKVYSKGKEHLLISVDLIEYPEYEPPDFDSSTEESYQISIAGYYVNGNGYLTNDKNSGVIITKSYTKNLGNRGGVVSKSISSTGPSIPVQSGGGSSGNSNTIGGITIDNTFKQMGSTFSEIVISSVPSNFRYIIDNNGSAILCADFKDTILTDYI